MKKTCAVLLLLFCTLGVALAAEPIRPSDVEGPSSWGDVSNVTHVRHLWFSGQPDEAALKKAKEEGIAVVINLRDPSESEWNEKAAVQSLGMSYYNVPVPGKEPFSHEAFDRIGALVKEHEGDQVWVHCSSSNRAGGWFATHLVREHGMSEDDALAVGRKVGISKDEIVSKVHAYLGAPASEKEAKP